jgi:hypothetical protein
MVSLVQSLSDGAPIKAGIGESYRGRDSARHRDQSTGPLVADGARPREPRVPVDDAGHAARRSDPGARVLTAAGIISERARSCHDPGSCRFGGRCLRVLSRRQGAIPISTSAFIELALDRPDEPAEMFADEHTNAPPMSASMSAKVRSIGAHREAREVAMVSYRCNFLTSEGKVFCVEDVEGETDNHAMEKIRRMTCSDLTTPLRLSGSQGRSKRG